MGTREETKGGSEWDMSSRKARRIVGGRAGSWTWVKTKFWRRVRKLARLRTEADAAEYDPAGDAAMARLRDTEYLWRQPGTRTMAERETERAEWDNMREGCAHHWIGGNDGSFCTNCREESES